MFVFFRMRFLNKHFAIAKARARARPMGASPWALAHMGSCSYHGLLPIWARAHINKERIENIYKR